MGKQTFHIKSILLMFLMLVNLSAKASTPHIKITEIWAYGDIVTDKTILDDKQNNLRFFCGTEEAVPFQQLDYQFMLDGYDDDWFSPFPEGWYFYTDLPPGDYVFRARCRLKGGEWGAEISHRFSIACPWWQTWWARLCYVIIAVGVSIYIMCLLRERVKLHNKIRVDEATKAFRDEFILQASRDIHAPLSIIRSIAERQGLNQSYPLSKTDIQHLRNSCRQMMALIENLIEFRPGNMAADYSSADDVIEMKDVPLNALKVIVVESDENLADMMERDLVKMLKVVRCTGNDEVMTIVAEEKPDAVVIDTNLQGKNAFELPKQIKQQISCVVVLVSDFLTTKDVLRAVHSEADDFVRKPFNCQYLTALIMKRLKDKTSDSGQQQPSTQKKTGLESGQKGKSVIIESRGDKIFLERLEAIVSANLSSAEFNVNALAVEMKISRAQLNIMIKRLTDKTPSEYIRECRLREAASLIASTNLTIQEIMFRVGITDSNYFYRRFKETYGMTPNAYRK